MPNILIHKLPSKDKSDRCLRTNFTCWINFLIALNDNRLSDTEKVLLSLQSVYSKSDFDKIKINNTREHLDNALDFLNGWKTDNDSSNSSEPIIDFEKDAITIYASFFQQYKLNLQREKLHWYEFMPLLLSLSQDTPMGFILYVRSLTAKDMAKMPKEQKKQMQELKAKYRLKGNSLSPKELRDMYLSKNKDKKDV